MVANQRIKNLFQNRTYFFLFVLFASLLLYLPRIIHSNYPMRDDELLIGPLLNIHNLAQYLQKFLEFKIFDLNPMRDLSFYLDIQFQTFTGLAPFHFVNWLLFVGILFFAYRFIQNRALFLLFAFHPIFVNSVAWISARKHLLAVFFLCIAIDQMRRHPLTKIAKSKIVLAYLLSILSQPITLFFPIWVLVYFFIHSHKNLLQKNTYFLLSLFVCMVAVAAANQWYYQNYFPIVSQGNAKYLADGFDAGKAILAISRAWFQVLLPLKVSPVEYYPGAPANFVGIILISFCLLYVWRKRDKEIYLALCLFFMPLLMVNLRPTNVFLSDTYLLLPALGIFMAAQILIEQHKKNIIHTRILYFLVIVFYLLSAILVNAWANQEKLWQKAYEVEATPRVAYVHAATLLKKGEITQARILAAQTLDNYLDANQVYSEALLAETGLTLSQKITQITADWRDTPWHRYTMAALLFQEKRYEPIPSLIAPLPARILLFEKNAGLVAAELDFFCSLLQKCKMEDLVLMEKILRTQKEQWQEYLERKKALREHLPIQNKSR